MGYCNQVKTDIDLCVIFSTETWKKHAMCIHTSTPIYMCNLKKNELFCNYEAFPKCQHFYKFYGFTLSKLRY